MYSDFYQYLPLTLFFPDSLYHETTPQLRSFLHDPLRTISAIKDVGLSLKHRHPKRPLPWRTDSPAFNSHQLLNSSRGREVHEPAHTSPPHMRWTFLFFSLILSRSCIAFKKNKYFWCYWIILAALSMLESDGFPHRWVGFPLLPYSSFSPLSISWGAGRHPWHRVGLGKPIRSEMDLPWFFFLEKCLVGTLQQGSGVVVSCVLPEARC